MSDAESFGRRAAASADPQPLLQVEVAEGKGATFDEVDALVSDVVTRSLRAERVVDMDPDGASVGIAGLSEPLRSTLDDQFRLGGQHERGAWYLPEQVSLKVGLHNLPSTFDRYPRFASGIVWEERTRVAVAEQPAAVFMWAVTEPLFELLFVPFDLRGRLLGTKTREEQLDSWASVDELAVALGLRLDDEWAVMRYGGGWGRIRAAEQLAWTPTSVR